MNRYVEQGKSAWWRVFEFVLLAVVLCVIAIRATHAESPNTTAVGAQQVLSNAAFSLIISAVLIFSFAVWVFGALFNSEVRYRFNWIEVFTCVFIAAGVIAVFAASNKRFAITELVTIASPMLAAVLLVQLLDSDFKIRLVLMVIAACGVTSTFKCADDYFSSNELMIEQYEEDPASQLSQLGIEEGSFQHFTYEHRLYSKDVRGFFTTGNSAGSFALLAFFAGLALVWRGYSDYPIGFLIAAALLAAILYGLVLTHSKGATAALIVSSAMLGAYLLLPGLLKRMRILIVILVIVAAAVITGIAVQYGLEHGRLPGGNSMLVRWQYWVGAVKMYLLKPWTGVGGGNFGNYYTHFKEAGALESVKDPHNFILSILSQYGPLGLAGFCGAFLVPVLKNVFGRYSTVQEKITDGPEKKKLTAIAIFVTAAMLVFRPVLIGADMGDNAAETVFVVFYLFIMPVVVFLIAYLLMVVREIKLPGGAKLSDKTGAILLCAMAGVILHNFIDFAIFEPGVLTAFWAIAACMTAWRLNRTEAKPARFNFNMPVRIGFGLALAVSLWAVLYFAVIPPVKASRFENLAFQDYGKIFGRLDKAAKADRLNPRPLRLNGKGLKSRLYLNLPQKDFEVLLSVIRRAIRIMNTWLKRMSLWPAICRRWVRRNIKRGLTSG